MNVVEATYRGMDVSKRHPFLRSPTRAFLMTQEFVLDAVVSSTSTTSPIYVGHNKQGHLLIGRAIK